MTTATLPQDYQKITVRLPRHLLQSALKASGSGISETITEALKIITEKPIYEKMLSLRGKVKLSLNINQLREDR